MLTKPLNSEKENSKESRKEKLLETTLTSGLGKQTEELEYLKFNPSEECFHRVKPRSTRMVVSGVSEGRAMKGSYKG